MYAVTRDFIGKPAPPGYVAGIGRGATGFTTRSDIGPARDSREDSDARGGGAENNTNDEYEERYQDPDNEVGLFSGAPYEKDDEEADRIWDIVDKKMEERRKTRREQREKEELARYRQEKPKIGQQFADLKRQLATISEDEWMAIPEVGDLVGKSRKRTKVMERFTPVPDSILAAARDQSQYETSLDDRQQKQGGLETPADGTMTNFREIGQARDKVLELKLDQASADSISGQTTIDPRGYLTSLSLGSVAPKADVSDIKKVRKLMTSFTNTNPKHPSGWIASARLEEEAGKLAQARALIAKGCENCPKSEDVWLEAARLNTLDNAKIILANAVREIPQSVKIWLRAADLESDVTNKKKVLRRSLEFIPNSVKLWRKAVNLEEDLDVAKILLTQAVEMVPHDIDLWLALARLETYDRAKQVLNKARSLIPHSHEIWIAAARLREENDPSEQIKTMRARPVLSSLKIENGSDAASTNNPIDTVMKKAVKELGQRGVVLSREQWLDEAMKCESNGSTLTCQAIVKATISHGVEEEDRRKTWLDDAETCVAKGRINTGRAIYAYALKVFPDDDTIWHEAAQLEKNHGTRESLEELLDTAVTYCPHAESLWLLAAKEKWQTGDVAAARRVLERAFQKNPDSEEIWLEAVRIESENQEYNRASMLLEKARQSSGTARVWMKSALLERQMKHYDRCIELIEEALKKYPTFDKFWMIKGQVEDEALGDQSKARETFSKAVKSCPKSTTLWVLLALLEEKMGMGIKARSTLERARYVNPKSADLWLHALRMELRSNNRSAAKSMSAKALQECPTSGAIWSEVIFLEARPQRKARGVDALKKCEDDPIVLTAVARLFWTDRKIEKARAWFQKAVHASPRHGDSYVWWYKFEMEHGLAEQKQTVIALCTRNEPKYGELWQSVAKHVDNVGKSPEEILKLCAAKVIQ